MIIRPSFSGLYQAGLDLNADAEAYIDAVQTNDSYTFSKTQKIAISDFFNALETESLTSKIIKMWLVGFSVNAGFDGPNLNGVMDCCPCGWRYE